MNSDERLGSWKEIGAYLQRDARTARRWEKEEGLPVHRHLHKNRSSVYAYPSEIDAWRVGRRAAPEPAVVRAWWRPLAVGVTTLLCLIMVGNGIRPQVVSAQQSRPVARQVWAGDGVDSVSSVSPDGRYLSLSEPSTGALVIRDLQIGANRRLTTVGGSARASMISPDSRQVAYVSRDGAGKIDLRILPLGGAETAAPRIVYRNEQITVLEPGGWTPDGKQLLVRQILADSTPQLAMVNVQDGSARILKSFRWGSLDGHPSLSPDGRYVAYSAAVDDKRLEWNVFVLSADAGRESKVTEGSATDFMVQWSADGSRVFFMSDRTGDNLSLWGVPVQEGKAQGPAAMVKADTGYLTLIRPTLRDGGLYYVTGEGRKNIYIADLNEELKAVKPPVLATQRFVNSTNGGSWSPDAQYLAFYRTNYITGTKLVIRTIATGAEREIPLQLRVPPYPSVAPPRWFPGVHSVLAVSYDEHGIGYYRVDLQTGNSELVHRPKSRILALAMAPVISPDGRTIFYRDTDAPDVVELLRFDLESRRETELARSTQGQFLSCIALSPDGAQLAYGLYDNASGSTALSVMPANGGPARKIVEFQGESDFSLAWSPDRRYVLFAREEKAKRPSFWKVPAGGGESERIFGFDSDWLYHPEIDPHSGRMIFGALRNTAAEVWALENFLPKAPGSATPVGISAHVQLGR